MGKSTGEDIPVTPDRTERIRGDIRQTEAEISATLNSIEEKFRPQHLKQEVKERVRDYSLKTMVQITEAVRRRPLPYVAAGAGVAWLLVRRVRKRRMGIPPRFTSADIVEAVPKKMRKDPVKSIRNYIKLGRMAIIIASAVSTYLVRRKSRAPEEPVIYGQPGEVGPIPARHGYYPGPEVQWR